MILEDCLAQVERATMPEERKAALLLDIRNLAKRLHLDPRSTDVSDPRLAERFADVHPAHFGVSPCRLRNLLSSWRTMLGLCDLVQTTRHLAPEWRVVQDLIDHAVRLRGKRPWFLIPLPPFVRFANGFGCSPQEVSLDLVDRYIEDNRKRYPEGKHDRLRRDLRIGWNKAKDQIDGWPDVRLPDPPRRDRFSLPLTDFPAAFQTDVARYLEARGLQAGNPDVVPAPYRLHDRLVEAYLAASHAYTDTRGHRRDRKPLKPSTARTHRYLIQGVATALVDSGEKRIEDINGLKDIATPLGAAVAIDQMLQRTGKADRVEQTEAHIISTLRMIAERWCDLSHSDREIFLALERDFRKQAPSAEDLSPKVAKRLLPFHDPKTVLSLYTLPDRILARVEARRRVAGRPSPEDARALEAAVAVAILFVDPLRLSNLAALDLDTNILLPAKPGLPARLDVPRSIVKTNRGLSALIPPDRVRMIHVFVDVYRPLLTERPGNRCLFPPRKGRRAETGAHRDPNSLARSITKLVWDDLGLTVNVHLFRAIAALVLYRYTDGNRHIVEDVLGHTRGSRATNKYLEIAHAWASDQLQRAFDAQQAALTTELRRGGLRKRARALRK